ncbi:MAG: hypothetical protein K8H75_07990 [Sulfuricella sp.]|nr:hypothetical protein [Sulfuricella sp.]
MSLFTLKNPVEPQRRGDAEKSWATAIVCLSKWVVSHNIVTLVFSLRLCASAVKQLPFFTGKPTAPFH